jgi:hypothetical protein
VKVICPYCKKKAKLIDSVEIYGKSYGKIWICWPCDARVGVHKNSKKNAPLGQLAGKKLREARKSAHATFDKLWKSGKMSRTDAYALMCEKLNIEKSQAHIGKFNMKQCADLIEAFKE